MAFFYTSLIVLSLFMGCSTSITEGPRLSTDHNTDKVGGGTPGSLTDSDLATTQFIVMDLLDGPVNDLQSAVESLHQKTHLACASSKIPLSDLKKDWTRAMTAFHKSEVFIFGPLLQKGDANLNDENPIKEMLYSMVDPGQQALMIDREIQKAFDLKEKYRPRSRKAILGLDALEYVFYSKDFEEGQVSAQSQPCEYLKYITADLLQRVNQLLIDWNEMVVKPLHTANGQTKGRYYLDRLTQGMVHFIDKGLKSRKVAVPLAIPISNNQSFPCKQGVDCHLKYSEHSHSLLGRESVILNLITLEASFAGMGGDKQGFGYNQHLQALGVYNPQLDALAQHELSDYWRSLPRGANYHQTLAAYDGSTPSDNKIYQGFLLLKDFTFWLKTDFIVDINLKLPDGVQGDND